MNAFRGKVAVHAITWGDNHLQALEDASRLGYRAIEPWPSFALQYEQNVTQFKELLAQHHLELSGLYGGVVGDSRFADSSKRREIVDYNERLARLLVQCGANHLVLGPGGPRHKPTSLEELKVAAVTIAETAQRTLELGVKACLHPHLWTEVQDENELDAIMELCNSDAVFLAPDTAQLTGAGMNPAEIIRRYKDRVAYVHLKDMTKDGAVAEDFPMLAGKEVPVFCELGLGKIEFDPIIEALNDMGYEGWLTVEIDQSTHTPYRSLEICREFVEQRLQIQVRK
ncbi:TIM barrel protein [Paenibacillus sp. JCM 10914]|uniref:sugar phosphate isomerase/epimerase family protein n=1 Tax=Paenibacillus sp. JCM 10914 TaxID=1236974 RepID=UPI0003CC56A3|nr:sugar phosphate isomerase/epimerase [Paenibacillus sp. JCM 10914]GAE05675.1 inosose dehydratase [Paenibacillus sp. JCM 10914]